MGGATSCPHILHRSHVSTEGIAAAQVLPRQVATRSLALGLQQRLRVIQDVSPQDQSPAACTPGQDRTGDLQRVRLTS